MIAVYRIALVAATLALPGFAQAQGIPDGHRGVCSNCHVGAGNNRYELSVSDSTLVFAIDSFGFSKIIGTFSDIGGGFVFDADDVEATSILAAAEVNSVSMGNAALDALVRSERFLDARNHPAISYQSDAVHRIDEQHFTVDGRLSIRGTERPVSLDVELNKLEPHPLTGRQTAGLVVTGRFARSDFGLTLGLPNIGDVVEFSVYAQGSLLD